MKNVNNDNDSGLFSTRVREKSCNIFAKTDLFFPLLCFKQEDFNCFIKHETTNYSNAMFLHLNRFFLFCKAEISRETIIFLLLLMYVYFKLKRPNIILATPSFYCLIFVSKKSFVSKTIKWVECRALQGLFRLKVMLMSHLQQSALICSDLLMHLAWNHLSKLCTVSFQLMMQSCLNYYFWI